MNKSTRHQPIGIGIYEEHNAGMAAVRGGEVLLYCEFERLTRVKNQAGWFANLIAGLLAKLPIAEIETISVPRPEAMMRLLVDYFGGSVESGYTVRVSDHPIHICHQENLHPLFHILAMLVQRDVQPDVYAVLVFDAERPRLGWVDLRSPLKSCPELHLRSVSDSGWFNGEIFADLFGKIFYGSRNLSHCGKLMGLASWGKTRISNVAFLRDLAIKHFDPNVPVWKGYRDVNGEVVVREVTDKFGVSPLQHDRPEILDLAAAAQELFSHELVTQIVHGIETIREEMRRANLPPPSALLYGGGCALSVVSNAMLREALDIPIIAPPYAHDASQFLGAAVWSCLQHKKDYSFSLGAWSGLPQHTVGHVSLEQLRTAGLAISPYDADDVAQRISNGQLVALVEQGSEAGPRALGKRSLLANALDYNMRDRLNQQVKKREWYRPFAPALPVEAFTHYFGEPATKSSSYMLDAFRVVPEHRSLLSSVSSPDGTSRPQTVYKDVSPTYYSILESLGKTTGHPIVLNTSLNGPGLPIAFDLLQVIRDCDVLQVDAAVVDGVLIEREMISKVARSGVIPPDISGIED